jgi:cold shock CspA family protein
VIGTVTRFFVHRAFGFIKPDAPVDGNGIVDDVFVHGADLAKSGIVSLSVGQRVSFDTGPGTKGPRAIGIKLLDA